MNSPTSGSALPDARRTDMVGGSSTPSSVADSSAVTLELVKPLIRCYHEYSFMFEISGSCRDRDNFIFSNYGNLSFIRTMWVHHWDPFDFFPAPRNEQWGDSGLIDAKRYDLSTSMNSPNGEIVEFVRSKLLEGRYCFVILDEFYIKNRGSYGIKHFIHNILVVGFDDKRREVALWGYFRLADSDYGMQWVSYDDFIKAFHYNCHFLDDSSNTQMEQVSWWYKCVETYNPVREARYDFSLGSVVAEVDGYLNSRFAPEQSRYHHRDLSGLDVSFGLGTYVTLRAYLDSVHADFNKVEDLSTLSLSHQPLRIFWEHKAVMVEKLKFIDRRGYAPIDRAIHAELAKILRTARKLSVTLLDKPSYKDKATLGIALDCLYQCREMEERCYEKIAKALASA